MPPVGSGSVRRIAGSTGGRPRARASRAAPHVARFAAAGRGADGEGAAAAAQRRLQQQLGDDRAARGGLPEDDGPAPIDVDADDAAPEPPAPPPPRRAPAAAAEPPGLAAAQGWADGAPPSLTASLSLVPRRAAALARHRSDDPVTGFFVKCKLAWQLFFPPKADKRKAPTPGEMGRNRLSMILVADRAGLSPGSLMAMKQRTVQALAESMDMAELADAQLKFTMVREGGVTYSMAVPIIDDAAVAAAGAGADAGAGAAPGPASDDEEDELEAEAEAEADTEAAGPDAAHGHEKRDAAAAVAAAAAQLEAAALRDLAAATGAGAGSEAPDAGSAAGVGAAAAGEGGSEAADRPGEAAAPTATEAGAGGSN
ncbi:hypothetical protein Rsub_00100 [Raphidocelis subcapitata]|uniref:Uncharacterized protein n=1 Tax=Raphidocelis subcapitata TaxID=307507 RepID=A0A2V0NK84_9CHLO|nr:hypothetical protein Rsub_00100 [Raphidocelis subcapitata]|eukprot:GBF87389.1 hypothetical protein Rsub_00100 [Raphidocelis subcapitata]